MDEAVRKRWVPVVAAVVVVAVLAVGGWAISDRRSVSRAGSPPAASASASAPETPAAVDLPPCADQAATDKMLLSLTADGAAKDAVTGTAVSKAFSLGNGAFSATPPPAGYVPAVTAQQAGCQLAAAVGVRGFTAGPGRLALASVTIARDLHFQSSVAQGQMFTNAYPGSLPTYEHRVAWILISAATNDVSSCPSMSGSSTPAPTTSPAPANPYEVFGIDAATGGSPIMYEDAYATCEGFPLTPASVSVPYQVLSVPWTVVSRAADGLTAQISASWSTCEVYTMTGATYGAGSGGGRLPTPVTSSSPLHAWIQSPAGEVSITVSRPFGGDCGPVTPHSLTLHPERVGATVPATIPHAPVGLTAPEVD